MKVLFIINSLKNKSGSERVAIELANKMAVSPDYDITLLNRESVKNYTAYPTAENVDVIALTGNLFQFYKKLKMHISASAYDIVIVHNMGKLSLLCAFIPNVTKLVSLEHVSFVSRPQKIQILSKLLYRKIDQVVTLTQNDKVQFDKFHSNVLVIPNFSPFPIASQPQNNNKQIVTIGRLTDQKNYIHLLQAWEKIYQSIPDWQLNIYGEGEHKEMLQNYISQRFLKNVSLKGSTSNVKEVYERSSFFVMSSKYEGLPMVLIEAQSFGLPIVSYNCPYGPSDVIQENQNGLLVEDQNIDKLAEAILKLASSPNLLDRFSQESLLNAKKYQPEQILKIWNEKILQG
ncbi:MULTISPECIES: glycosyltransferase family 4 protein [Acinetobacter]|uniref:glycosyltransferase family 4 protein n=1 Tax=Acinetobacter TaxID=469 RepID=UPI0002B9A72F|nr:MULTISPECIES: glycosyltransferase family 4 protein [Acinetobacter]MBU3818392.1 glycosyltransferase family 4 protein [Acinetobacter baumannii]MCO9051288.1 glycosyltransferase family 4 protein [Acinetobacter sp. UC24323]MCR0076029.1 glycosyltransferase family 4 protein [Acinetobacter baumannii]MDC4466383.1 glycosyltransferase family 4 protein [Acinetobacter baumannii]MDQ9037478.1 glycosyltransferase family 4 protein [Acinetobacter seifertii]